MRRGDTMGIECRDVRNYGKVNSFCYDMCSETITVIKSSK